MTNDTDKCFLSLKDKIIDRHNEMKYNTLVIYLNNSMLNTITYLFILIQNNFRFTDEERCSRDNAEVDAADYIDLQRTNNAISNCSEILPQFRGYLLHSFPKDCYFFVHSRTINDNSITTEIKM
ncbi:hypothetical protein PUN28_010215 [Cardiocondyla obscurior]|uniref:Uncharacterized protein n=1 Tax=Cardiocondyla obscurior TaxID=286306 RepID=A0AAW2FQ29_9HYME